MDLFNTLSDAINPQPPMDKWLLGRRIKLMEQSIQDYMNIIHDIETEIVTLKSQLNDTPKTSPANTISDDSDLDYDMVGFV